MKVTAVNDESNANKIFSSKKRQKSKKKDVCLPNKAVMKDDLETFYRSCY